MTASKCAFGQCNLWIAAEADGLEAKGKPAFFLWLPLTLFASGFLLKARKEIVA
jgi:hypothetical protein